MALREEFSYPSSDGRHQIHALRWLPEESGPRAVVQLVHGISEHMGRYDGFAAYLADHGFAVVGHDHLGHGKTARGRREYGFLGEQNGWAYLVHDTRTLRELTGERFSGLPHFLMGHSMGSFVVRTYLIDYPGTVDGCILSGTGQEPPFLVAFGRGLSGLLLRIKGGNHVSGLVTALSLGAYNRQFRPTRTSADWISRDQAVVDAYVRDPMCRFVPTVGMFHDMMGGLQYIWKTENLNKMDKSTPVYFMAGDGDPVGNYGEAVKKVYERFLKTGCKDVKLKLYKDGRHEMLNELNKDEVYADVLEWLNSKI